jgi:hypothetical protein
MEATTPFAVLKLSVSGSMPWRRAIHRKSV